MTWMEKIKQIGKFSRNLPILRVFTTAFSNTVKVGKRLTGAADAGDQMACTKRFKMRRFKTWRKVKE